MVAKGKYRVEGEGCFSVLFLKLETDLSMVLRSHGEAEFENRGKKRKPDGTKSLN